MAEEVKTTKPEKEKEKAYKRIRYLDPSEITLSLAENGTTTVRMDTGEVFERARAYCTRPTSFPRMYISLRYGEKRSEEIEIGIIRDIDQMVPSQKMLIERELEKRYFVHRITKIKSLKNEFGFFYWDVETDRGPKEFAMYWSKAYCFEVNEKGRMVIDTDGNQYSIPVMADLDEASQKIFSQQIYW
ncbi:MAG TPA: DUF1854 domain-containing protein [Candidatus Brocadiia bacterium]|nr:DUF1854 domain-containing protein [Candidatus Brocadiia bacterium]